MKLSQIITQQELQRLLILSQLKKLEQNQLNRKKIEDQTEHSDQEIMQIQKADQKE